MPLHLLASRSKQWERLCRTGAALLLALVSSELQSQSFPSTYREVELCQDPYNRSTFSCTLARIGLSASSGGTYVTLGLTNLQGTPSASVIFSALHSFQIIFGGAPVATDFTTQAYAERGGAALGPPGQWTWKNQSVAQGNTGFHSLLGIATNPIEGCNSSVFSSSPQHFSTCGRDAWAHFEFEVPNRYSQADIRGFALGDYQLPNIYGPLVAVVYCEYAYVGRQSCDLRRDVIVTPEPMTLPLVSAGILLLGAFGCRRGRSTFAGRSSAEKA